jgi:two-component system, chemotaxis family, sensor histidine kinase and response regulator PixL
MTFDPSIREQGYQYFLQEAPELLQVLEQGLLSLREDHSINKVNTLMRATHTLKGAAASIGLDTIATVAHSLEDVFKTFCNPDVEIDLEVETLLLEGFDCLRLPLKAEFAGEPINHFEVLDRTATVFAQLQEKLGDCFGQDAHLPTSAELGFDVTLSIFEVGVAQRLDQLAIVLADDNHQEIISAFRSQAEVFLGLAESLNLPGFGEIAQVTITALDNHPAQAVTIAKSALSDFKSGQAAVLGGDRSQGGQASKALLQIARRTSHPLKEIKPLASEQPRKTTGVWGTLTNLFKFFQEDEDAARPPTQLSTSPTARLLPASDRAEPSVQTIREPQNSELHNQESAILLETIWGGQAVSSDLAAEQSPLLLTAAIETSQPEPKQLTSTAKIPSSQGSRSAVSQKSTLSPTVRVNVEHLDRLNYSVGELLTNQNRQSLQTEQTQAEIRTLYTRLRQQQQQLDQLQDWIYRQSKEQKAKGLTPRKSKQLGELQLLAQRLLADAVQVTEATDAIDLFVQQSSQTLEKQGRLLIGTRDALIEARMLPLGYILDRFHRVLQQLETLHDKQVILELQGTEVMVDKVVVEKLYDPLLHLVRNAFDHGVEPAAIRQQRGKEEVGQIKIIAHNQGRRLLIEVRDDGNGLNFDQIRQRAVDRQLISLEQVNRLTEAQLTDLLFEPGFSTASQVNDLSGRGIGLDVVRDQLKALRGSVTVHSEPGQGTTFTLQIPLSLTIAPLLLCRAGFNTYALLDDAIEQIVLPKTGQLQTRNGCRVLQWSQGSHQTLIPISSLTQILSYNSAVAALSALQTRSGLIAKDQVSPVILIRCQKSLLGLEVDQLLGEQELVIRPLGDLIRVPSYVHGASILADGQLSLVLDGATLLQKTCDRPSAGSDARTHSVPSLSLEQPLTSPQGALPVWLDRDTESSTTILIVEDSITVRQALALTLQKAGYRVFQAEDGSQALEQFQHQTDIQLVICDLEMPRMSGFEFLSHRQQIPALSNVPVMMLTSRSDERHRLLASQLGATAYMTKPYMEYKLLGIVAELLERTVQHARSQGGT